MRARWSWWIYIWTELVFILEISYHSVYVYPWQMQMDVEPSRDRCDIYWFGSSPPYTSSNAEQSFMASGMQSLSWCRVRWIHHVIPWCATISIEQEMNINAIIFEFKTIGNIIEWFLYFYDIIDYIICSRNTGVDMTSPLFSAAPLPSWFRALC